MPPLRTNRRSKSPPNALPNGQYHRPASSQSATSNKVAAGQPYPAQRRTPRLAPAPLPAQLEQPQSQQEQITSPDRALMALLQADTNHMISQMNGSVRTPVNIAPAPPRPTFQPVNQHSQQPIQPQPQHQHHPPPPPPQHLLQHPNNHFHHHQIQLHPQPHAQAMPHHQAQHEYSYAVGPIQQQMNPGYHGHALPSADFGPVKSRVSSGANADFELRDFLERNIHRSLEEVSADVVANEKTSSAEKCKQLFAMLWLKQNIVASKHSIPRIRVHTRYASKCSTYHLQPLNQASFGKLVRVLFPEMKTRRLGIRGESKYHYVDLSLIEDLAEGNADHTKPRSRSGTNADQHPSSRLHPCFEIDSAVIPTENISSPSSIRMNGQTPSTTGCHETESRIFSAPLETNFHPQMPSYRHRMKFSSSPIMRQPEIEDTKNVDLPKIYDFAPAKWDSDIKDALQATYLSHAINLNDSVRFCKKENFFHCIAAFQGTMTVPVVKLFFHEDVAPWVRACDFLVYQKIIRFLAPLTLQVVPPKVLKFLWSIAKLLHGHVEKTFATLPKHTLDAKLESAAVFCHILTRLLRANQTAHAAGAVLTDDEVRLGMWSELVATTNPKAMMSAFIPDCGYDEDVYKLLTFDIRNLLLPLATDPKLEENTHYHLAATHQNSQHQPPSFELDRIGSFIESLKARYPTVPSKDLLHLIQSITSYILRDIFMEEGHSYTCWTIFKCFIDELTLLLIHAGGFLDYNPLPLHMQSGSQPKGVADISNSIYGTSPQDSPLQRTNQREDAAMPRPQSSSLFGTQEAHNMPLTPSIFTGSNGSKHHQDDGDMLVNGAPTPSQDVEMDDSGIGLSSSDENADLAKKRSDTAKLQSTKTFSTIQSERTTLAPLTVNETETS